MKNQILINRIIEKAQLHPLRVKNIYIYGSQVYGTNEDHSDIDIILIGSSMHSHKEFSPESDELNIHLTTADQFKMDLGRHEIKCFECLYAPKEFILQEKEDMLKGFKFDKNKLKRMAYGESFQAWKRAKSFIETGDFLRGTKAIFHGLRILDFAIQICEHKKIINFKSSNGILALLQDSEYIDYYQYKDAFFPSKIKLEKKLKMT